MKALPFLLVVAVLALVAWALTRYAFARDLTAGGGGAPVIPDLGQDMVAKGQVTRRPAKHSLSLVGVGGYEAVR